METIPTRMAPLWNEQGLIPVITQDATNGDVLMLAWMNEEALSLTWPRDAPCTGPGHAGNCGARVKHQATYKSSWLPAWIVMVTPCC